jgi:hypothetical protein
VELRTFAKFLTNGVAELEAGWVAVGIHPSSEVCLVDVNGVKLGVGAIVPIGKAATKLYAVHWPLNGDQLIGAEAGNYTPADGQTEFLGDNLVLQLYSDCDALIPPGPRMPFYKDVRVLSAEVGATAELAKLAMRIPFHGRAACAIAVTRPGDTDDVNILVVGRAYGRRNPSSFLSSLWEKAANNFGDQGGVWHEMAVQTRQNGGGVGATTPTIESTATGYRWRQFVVGGEADASETFDELLVFVYSAAAGDVWITAEAYGERTH